MKNNTKLHSAALALATLILFIIIVSSTVSAASPKITETRITTHGTAEIPAIYGNIIAWQDNRNGNWDIYIYDLSNKKEIHTTNLANQTSPAIYGDKVVWEDDRNGASDIYMEDLSTKKQTRITTHGKASNPAIYSNRIVWQDERNVSVEGDIYMYDLSTHKETKISTSGLARDPKIYGDKIIWLDDRYEDTNGDEIPDIYMYDLSTHKETQIPRNNSCPGPNIAIFGNRIVWQDYSYSDIIAYYNIYVYDLSTHKETQIATNNSMQNKKSLVLSGIYSDRIVCETRDWDGTIPENVYMYDLSTHQKTQITTSGSASGPAVYGDRIVYADHRNYGDLYKYDIYMSTLSYLPVAAFSASPISGKTPLTVKFTDKSTGSPTSRSWNFGDKSTPSTAQNPAHKYTKAGKYTVTLTVKNVAGINTKKISNYITVN
jgi:beta propeller repeat protein